MQTCVVRHRTASTLSPIMRFGYMCDVCLSCDRALLWYGQKERKTLSQHMQEVMSLTKEMQEVMETLPFPADRSDANAPTYCAERLREFLKADSGVV